MSRNDHHDCPGRRVMTPKEFQEWMDLAQKCWSFAAEMRTWKVVRCPWWKRMFR